MLPAHQGFITCSNYRKNDFRLQYQTDQILIFFPHYNTCTCTCININISSVLVSQCLCWHLKKTGWHTVYLRGGPGSQEKKRKKNWKAKKGNPRVERARIMRQGAPIPLFTVPFNVCVTRCDTAIKLGRPQWHLQGYLCYYM